MHDKPFSVYEGIFICQKCGEEVKQLRLWRDTLDLTWQCSKKHVSKVNLRVSKYGSKYKNKKNNNE